MEKEIFYINVRSFTSKKDKKTYYVVDYVRSDTGVPKSDFISALEYTEISKKMKDKTYTKAIGIFSINEYDRLYLSSIK